MKNSAASASAGYSGPISVPAAPPGSPGPPGRSWSRSPNPGEASAVPVVRSAAPVRIWPVKGNWSTSAPTKPAPSSTDRRTARPRSSPGPSASAATTATATTTSSTTAAGGYMAIATAPSTRKRRAGRHGSRGCWLRKASTTWASTGGASTRKASSPSRPWASAPIASGEPAYSSPATARAASEGTSTRSAQRQRQPQQQLLREQRLVERDGGQPAEQGQRRGGGVGRAEASLEEGGT